MISPKIQVKIGPILTYILIKFYNDLADYIYLLHIFGSYKITRP